MRTMRMTHTLVKLSVASAGHGWVIAAVHFGNVVALYVSYLVHGQITGKRHLTREQVKDNTTLCTNGRVHNVKPKNKNCDNQTSYIL